MAIKSKYLRLSVTDECNLHCNFCHKEGQKGKAKYLLTLEDIKFVVSQCVNLGFDKFKLTGGEPLIKKDILDIVSVMSKLNLPNFSMITNGVRLKELAHKLRQAGLPRLNVTIQTFNEDVFKKTIHEDIENIKRTKNGIDQALKVGYTDLKLNFVYHSDVLKKDINDVTYFASERNLTLVLLPVLLKGERADDDKRSAEDVIKKLFSDKIEKEEDFLDEFGIKKRLIRLHDGAKILIRLNELSDISPYKECASCGKKFECCEGIFPIRILSDGTLLPCMEEGRARVDIKDIIISRNDLEFRKIMNGII